MMVAGASGRVKHRVEEEKRIRIKSRSKGKTRRGDLILLVLVFDPARLSTSLPVAGCGLFSPLPALWERGAG
jgi:hypothetical protein